MSKLKVLRISHTATVASYRARERALVTEFPVDLQVVVPAYWPHLGAEPSEDALEPFPIHRAATIGTGNIPLFAFDPSVIKRVLRDFQPDIVDIHEEAYSVAGFQSALLARQHAPQAALLFYTAQNIYKRYPPPFAWTEQFVYSACAAAYPCSSEAAAVLRKKGFRKLAPVIPLGIDDAKFNTSPDLRLAAGVRRESLSLGNFVLGYFGRVEPHKGIQYIFQSLAKLAGQLDCSLVIVGSGSYRQRLEQLAAELKIQDRIRWAGEKPAREIPEWMAMCDAIVVPSITTPSWKEQFGRVPVEAMACGVPVVSFASGSLPDVVGPAGFLVPEADVDALTEAIGKLSSDAQFRRRLVQTGLQMVQEKYTWSKVADRMFRLYSSISKSGPIAYRSQKLLELGAV